MEKICILASLCSVILLLSAHPAFSQSDLPELLPEDLEVDLALSALPVHLRQNAGVFVLRRGGYEQIREESNGFVCLVRQSGAVPGVFRDSIIPICYDRVGKETVLPAVFDEVRMLEKGKSDEEVAIKIAENWKAGIYDLPGHGISYMLSPIFHLNGQSGGYVPHLMFYSPYMTDEEVGASDDRYDYVPFIQSPGLPSAVMVVPVGEQERMVIEEREEELISRVTVYIEQHN